MPDESYLSVLRSQPILLIGLSEEDMSTNGLIALGLTIIPILYGFGELAFQSGKTQETAKLADKRQAAEEKAYKDIKAYEASAARYKAQAEAMEKERREIEAIAEANHPTKPWRDAMRDRPWWAGPEWVPPEKPNDPDRWPDKQVPEGMHALASLYKDAKGNKLKEFGLRHFKLGFNAEEAKKKGERYEADKARLAARWGESSESKSFKGPHKGFHPIFEDINHKGQEKPKSQEEILKALSENHVKAKVASNRARELRKARDDGKPANQRKGIPAVKKLSEVWDEEAKVEAEERYQSTLINPVPSRRQLEDQKKQDELYIDMAKRARAQEREAKEKQKATPAPPAKPSFWRKRA
jgi:colicin import membrane protein